LTKDLVSRHAEHKKEPKKKTFKAIPVTMEEVLRRAMLSRSKGKAGLGLDPSVCPHPTAAMMPRGGHTYWWTCVSCGARWHWELGEAFSDC
jgi:hypothetical protein